MSDETKAAVRECARLACPGCSLSWVSVCNGGIWEHGGFGRSVECLAYKIRARFPEAFEEEK